MKPAGSRWRPLAAAELDRFDHISSGLLDRVRVLRSDLLPRAADGLTIGRFVFIRSDHFPGTGGHLLAHELVHVRQYLEMGVLRFIRTYLAEYLVGMARFRSHRAAYLAISFEEEARREAAEWARRHAEAAP